MEIQGKYALVTGGGRRVGREIALALARKRAHILLHYNTSLVDTEKTAVDIRALGGGCDLFQADLAKSPDLYAMTDRIFKTYKAVDILVNNASLFYKTPIRAVRESDWDRLVGANLKGPFLLSKEIGVKMLDNSGGKIINLADWSGFRPYRDYSAYCVSKGGLITLTKALARDLAPKVLVNAIAPGPVLLPEGMPEEEKQAIIRTTPLGRIGTPRDIAHAVIFLIENDFINGTVLVVDGGRSIV